MLPQIGAPQQAPCPFRWKALSMRFIVLGAGAIGGVIGGRLTEYGHEVVLIARGEHFDALFHGGLRLESPEEATTFPVPTVASTAAIDFGMTLPLSSPQRARTPPMRFGRSLPWPLPDCQSSALRTESRTNESPCAHFRRSMASA